MKYWAHGHNTPSQEYCTTFPVELQHEDFFCPKFALDRKAGNNMKYDKIESNGITYFRFRQWDSVLKKYTTYLYGKTLAELTEKYEAHNAKRVAGIKETSETFAEYYK